MILPLQSFVSLRANPLGHWQMMPPLAWSIAHVDRLLPLSQSVTCVALHTASAIGDKFKHSINHVRMSENDNIACLACANENYIKC